MNDEIKDKIAKVMELANRGVEGEKAAAQKALERLMEKYNLSDEDLSKIKFKLYSFKYKTNLDIDLFVQLVSYFFKDKKLQIGQSPWRKELDVSLEYLDWVTLDCAYAYFRKHAATQFNEFCLPHVKKCRTTKTRNARRATLQKDFFSKYVIASGIYHPEQLTNRTIGSMTAKEIEEYRKREAILGNVQGGQYHTQVAKETKLLD